MYRKTFVNRLFIGSHTAYDMCTVCVYTADGKSRRCMNIM